MPDLLILQLAEKANDLKKKILFILILIFSGQKLQAR